MYYITESKVSLPASTYNLQALFGNSVPATTSTADADELRKRLPELKGLDRFKPFTPHRQLIVINNLFNNQSLLTGINKTVLHNLLNERFIIL